MEPTAFDESGHADETRKITLTRRDFRDAVRLLRLLVEGDDQSELIHQTDRVIAEGQSFIKRTGGVIANRQALIKRARRAIAERNKRSEVFGKAMFGEPAWDMLLILYVEHGSRRLTIGRLSQVAGTSGTTALRWSEYLERQGLIQRQSHPTDRRTFFVGFTDRGLRALDLYFSEILVPLR